MVPPEASAEVAAVVAREIHEVDQVTGGVLVAETESAAQPLTRSASDSKLTEHRAAEQSASGGRSSGRTGSLLFWLPNDETEAAMLSGTPSMAGSQRASELDEDSNFSMSPADILGVASSSGLQEIGDQDTLVAARAPICRGDKAASTAPLAPYAQAGYMDFALWSESGEHAPKRGVLSGHSGPWLQNQHGGLPSDGVGLYASAGILSPWQSQTGSQTETLVHKDQTGLSSTNGYMDSTWVQPKFTDSSQQCNKIGMQLQDLSGCMHKGKGKANANWKEQPKAIRQPPSRPTQTPVSDQATSFMDKQTLLALVPINDEGEKASIGSRNHPDKCSPCIFWFRELCGKGMECDYCHFRHPGQKNKRIRPSKNTRLQMRAQQAGGEEGSGATMV